MYPALACFNYICHIALQPLVKASFPTTQSELTCFVFSVCIEHELVKQLLKVDLNYRIIQNQICAIILLLEDQLEPLLHANTLANVC